LSEFFVTLAETITFRVIIGPESFHWLWVTALIIGGNITAPVAAYTSKRIPARLLGVSVGLILVVTNVRTIFRNNGFDIKSRSHTHACYHEVVSRN